MTTFSSLECLPAELLYEIHLFCTSDALPISSKTLYAVFRNASTLHRCNYIFQRYIDRTVPQLSESREECTRRVCRGIFGLITYTLLYPLSDQRGVIEGVLHLSQAIPSLSQCFPIPTKEDERIIKGHTNSVELQHTCSSSKAGCALLPKRLFRDLTPHKDSNGHTTHDRPLPFLSYLFKITLPTQNNSPQGDPARIRISVNAHEGYALVHAVHANHRPLIRFLLRAGANPNYKQSLAIRIAIRRKDLELVQTLIERDEIDVSEDEDNSEENNGPVTPFSEKRFTNTEGPPGQELSPIPRKMTPGKKKLASGTKRRRLEDRVQISPDLLKLAVHVDARDIVQYFMDKGARPNINILSRMRGGGLFY